MKKNIILFITIAMLTLSAGAVSAINLGTDQDSILNKAGIGAGFSETTTETTFAEILGNVVKTALSFVGIIFLSLMVYAGYLWMTARGDESQIEKAQDMIRAAIIGLIITVGAYSITAFIVPAILNRAA